ncbi:MAG TPA: hypothetical protein VF806_06105, partial [Anaerolineaceae bacterium]
VWWSQPDGTYAMSLTEPGNVRYPVSHWAVIVPLEVGLATPEHAAQTFTTLRAQYLTAGASSILPEKTSASGRCPPSPPAAPLTATARRILASTCCATWPRRWITAA